MEKQLQLFCEDELDHSFQVISHSCVIEVVYDSYDRHYKGISTLTLLCKVCGLEDTRRVESETESYIL